MPTLIIGTNRQGSVSGKVACHLIGVYKEMGVSLDVIDLADLPPALFTPEAYETKPEGFSEITDKVVNADGLIVIVPEYNGSFPGILKHFIDMLPFPESFEGRPVCFIGLAAGQWGALRAVEQLQHVFGYRNAHVFPQRVFMSGVYKTINEQGAFESEELSARLKKQAAAYLQYIQSLQD